MMHAGLRRLTGARSPARGRCGRSRGHAVGGQRVVAGLVEERVDAAVTECERTVDRARLGVAGLVARRSDLANLLLLAATLLLVVQARRRRLGPAALRRLPALWSWAATLVLGLSFADLAGLPPWRGGLAISVSAASLPALLVLAAPGRIRPTLAFLLTLLTAALLFADLLYMQLLGSIVPVQALVASHQVGDIGGSIAALATPADRWLAAPVLAGLLLALAWPRVPTSRSPRTATLALALLAPLPLAVAMAAAMAGKSWCHFFCGTSTATPCARQAVTAGRSVVPR